MAVIYRCPQCRQKFKWDITKSEPVECHAEQPCGYSYREAPVDADGNDVIEMPAFLSAKSKLTDATARQIMDASEQRVHQAAEMAGVSASDMAGLKITNMTDDKGSAFNVPDVKNEVTKTMDAAAAQAPQGQGLFGYNPQAGLGFSGAVSSGSFANAGARTQRSIRATHARNVSLQHGTNEQGKTVAPRTDVMSDRPALELNNAGYRPRV